MEHRLNPNIKEIKSTKLLKKYNELNPSKQLGLVKYNDYCYGIYNTNDKYRIDNRYMAYRLKIKEVYFGSKYEINKYLAERLKYSK